MQVENNGNDGHAERGWCDDARDDHDDDNGDDDD